MAAVASEVVAGSLWGLSAGSAGASAHSSRMSIVFLNGNVRLSTVLAMLAFFTVALLRRDLRRVLVAAWAWMAGWECGFQLIALAFGRGVFGWTVPVILGVLGPALAWRLKVRPSLRLTLIPVAIMAVWAATGFHINEHSGVDFSALAEVFNEAGKTAFALAYLLPLWRQGQRAYLERALGSNSPSQSSYP